MGQRPYTSEHFHPALTDQGMCMVWNGEAMSQVPSKLRGPIEKQLNNLNIRVKI